MASEGGNADGREAELPDGVIPLGAAESQRSACAVTGCLYAVTVFFAVALIALVVGLAIRMWITPVMPRM
jgi:hypothetical protein